MMANLKQRPLEFRAWDGEREIIVDGDAIEESEDYFTRLSYGRLLISSEKKNGDYYELTPLQFTGLKDKNGVDIYEGDILSNGVASGVMEWVELNHTNAWSMFAPKGSFEVIGNIFENPELLKDK